MTDKSDEILKSLLANIEQDKIQSAKESEKQVEEAAAKVLAKAFVTLLNRMEAGKPVVETFLDHSNYHTRVRAKLNASIEVQRYTVINDHLIEPSRQWDIKSQYAMELMGDWKFGLLESVGINPVSKAYRMIREEMSNSKLAQAQSQNGFL